MHANPLTTFARAELGLTWLAVRTSRTWASSRPGFREAIRRDIAESLGSTELSILALDALPVSQLADISVSHNANLGGYALAGKGEPIGFDVERLSRLSRRSSSFASVDGEELAAAPCAELLWPAKEAAFKAMGPALQPRLIRQIVIGTWSSRAEGIHSFRVLRHRDGSALCEVSGAACVIGDQVFALATRSTPRSGSCAGY